MKSPTPGEDQPVARRRGAPILSRQPLFWVAVAALVFIFADLGGPALNFGEGMYAEIAREMRQSGDWVTPRLNGTPHFDKPPLLYWLIGLNQAVFGETEFAARFWPALAAWLSILAVGSCGRALYGARAGWAGALVMAACAGPYLYGRQAMPDALVVFLTTLAVLGYGRGFVRGDGRGPWPWVMFAAFGLGFLAKGLVGIGLPVAVIGVHAVCGGQLRTIGRRPWRLLAGAALTAAIVAPWVVAVALANRGFLSYFFFREHLARFAGQRFPRDEFLSLPLFLLFALMWTFPWLATVPGVCRRGFASVRRCRADGGADLLPLIWLLLVIGLFSASRSRLEYYSLPAIPAFALLSGRWWDGLLGGEPGPRPGRELKIGLAFMAIVSGVAALGAAVVLGPAKDLVTEVFARAWPTAGWQGDPEQMALLDLVRWPSIGAILGVAAFTAVALWGARRNRPRVALGMLAAQMVFIFPLIQWGFRATEPVNSLREVAGIALSAAEPADTLVFQEPHEFMWVGGMAYYTRRPVLILKEPAFEGVAARRREPRERFLDLDQVASLWHSPAKVVLVLEENGYAHAQQARFPASVLIGRAGGYVVLANRSAPPARTQTGPTPAP